MRNLHALQQPDGGLIIVDRQPGPYSHSTPLDVVVFTATAEEMAIMQDVPADRRTPTAAPSAAVGQE